MKTSTPTNSVDLARQAAILIAAPLIWICSSLGLFIDSARSPSDFSDLTKNLLVPQTFAFSIWLPIFLGILAYACLQALRVNQTRAIFRETGWWVAAGLWGIVAWGLVTAFAPDAIVEALASLIFIPTMIALVIAMIRFARRKEALDKLEHWLILAPISLIAGWCSIAVFVGLNGFIWSLVEPLGWSMLGTALSVLGLALWWAVYILRHGARNPIYAFPILWGLGFLALRHIGSDGETSLWIGGSAIFAALFVLGAATIGAKSKGTNYIGATPAE